MGTAAFVSGLAFSFGYLVLDIIKAELGDKKN